MKYRRLTKEELEEFKDDFVQFLAANSVTADDWEALKANEPDKAEKMIDLFSDIIFEKVLEKIEYLEFRATNDVKVFHCGEKKMELLGMKVEGVQGDLDLSNDQVIQDIAEQPDRLPSAEVKIYSGEKGYEGERNNELFQMMERGCRPGKESLFRTLKEIRETAS